MVRHGIAQAVKNAVRAVYGQINLPDFSIEVSENPEHGDYATNVALVLAKVLKKPPMEIAVEISNQLPLISYRTEAAPPGFINFFLSDQDLIKRLSRLLQKGVESEIPEWKRKKVMMEFTDPNPFKEFHIGHLYSNIVGEALCRILESVGAKVRRANYQGDVGLHVAKAVFGIRCKLQSGGISFEDLAKKSFEERMRFLGESYVLGAKVFEEGEEAKAEMTDLNKKIFAGVPEIKYIYTRGRAWSLEYFEKIYKRLGTKFDFYYFESKVGKIGEKLVREWLKKGVFEESEGAIVFPGEKYGLHRRVFINSQGLPTYEAKELGLAPVKFKDFRYDRSIIITGSEIVDYFKVLLEALRQIYPELALKTTHIAHGMVRLQEGKMSSRTGDVIRAEELLDEMAERVKKASGAGGNLAESIGVGAVKYSLLRVGVGKDIIFDPDTSLSIEGDSGPYLQYAHARFSSIIRKAPVEDSKIKIKDVPLDKQEHRLLVSLLRMPEVLEDALENFSPSVLAGYLHELAQMANEFYHSHPVLAEKNREKRNFRLALVRGLLPVLARGLWCLGLSAPEKM